MILGVANVQRLEDEHFLEWFAYYLIQGVDKFILYTHSMPGDPHSVVPEQIQKLKKHFDITHKEITGYNWAQDAQSIMDGPRNECDWLIWADSDEYYFPVEKQTVKEVLQDYEPHQISALGVYWCFFGSSNITEKEPEFITQSFVNRSNFDYVSNYHMKSIVKGSRAGTVRVTSPHVYTTQFGTYDMELRQIPTSCPLNHKSYSQGCPSVITHNVLRINHYYSHSFDWFQRIKMKRGPGDRPPEAAGGTITRESYDIHDRNEVYDNTMWEKYGEELLKKINELKLLVSQ
jgi:Glycosyltransferase family 92